MCAVSSIYEIQGEAGRESIYYTGNTDTYRDERLAEDDAAIFR